ncbi:InlB B-repeat-containing protein [Bifidobacterium longum]|uniref:InlB B-repeat-containing protein n=1 Tax=Bifidobacterium longum TaxID=216816 RepID=UPI00374E9853
MHAWLKRAVAGLLSAGTLLGGGLLTAGTANADEIRMPDIDKTITSLTASAATTYPRELVNGDFEYPSMKSLQHYFTGIDRNRSQWISNGQGGDLAKWSDIPGGLDTTRFGWSSTQTQGAMSEQRANAVELQKATGETTQMGELCASQKGTAIYQDIATTPGTLYRIELDHASRYRIHLDQMQVMVGAPGHEQPVEMTRTSSNKYGDKIGEKSTTIATHSTNPFGNQSSKDDFSHYVGYYTIPAGQSVTRFTFRQVSGVNTTSGNLLDNIVFTQAYKLDYDRNSDEATGQTPNDTATVKPAKTSATGGVKNVADTNASLPGHLVNGDFEYLPDGGWKTVDAPSYMTNAYTSVDPNNGQYMRNAQHSDADLASWADWPGFDQSKFAWKTDQKGGHDQGGLKDRAEAVELQQDSADGNTYAEMVASETGRTIYQNLATIPGTLYKIRLKHASLCKDNVDQMQVVINGTPIEMTRVAANGKAGDKVGEKSKTIGTRVTNGNRWHHYDQWETYEGYYVIPDGQTTTRFGFKAVNYLDPTKGNLLDDVTFARAYKLSYDKNAQDATGKVPSNQRGKENAVEPAESKTTGNVKTVADNTSNLPDHLVNGTFDYRGNEIINENQRVYGDTTYLAIISAKTGVIGNPLHSKLNNWDSGKFGWKSNDATAGVDTVEVQRRNHTPYPTNAGNVWGEIAAAKRGKYIYQDIATTPGIMYKWSLKHASRNADQDDSMQVMIGEPGKTVAQQATRTTSNGSDKTGSVGTTITTHGTAQDGKWETYTGTYIATSTTTRFTFRSVRDSNGQGLDFTAEGNCVDDLSFDKAYKLSYDKNAQDATGSVPSNQYGKENTVQPAKSKTTGSVGLAADKTASGLTVHDLKNGEIAPVQYGDFKFSTTDGFTADQITDVNGFDVKTNWDPTEENQAYAGKILSTMYQPNKNGANLILHHVGQWRDSSGTQRWLNAKITVNGQNLGSLVYLESKHEFTASYGKWDLHPSSRPYMDVTVDFLLDDGSTPQGLRGATGFTDIDGGTSGYNEGVELVSGFDGAYVRSDAHLARFGTNGWAGITDENKNNADAHGMKHYVGATFTGSSFRVRWSVASGQARQSGFQPVDSTIAYRLTYDKNAQDATGSIPSDTAANTTQPAKSETDGKVSDLVQRTTTHEDGSVTVKTIDTSTDVVSGCQVYYPAGTRITLATAKADSDCWDSSQIGRINRTFYGWSANTDANDRDVPVGDTMDRNTLNANVRTEIVMPARAKTVYALWAINPTLSYNVNAPAGSNAPVTPASRTVPYNTAAPDTSGWQTGDTGKIPGYRFDGWYTAPNGGNKYDFNTPLTGNVTVYAHWVGNGYTVRFAGNGATGGGTPDQAFQYNIGQNLRRNGFTRDGYTFTGWKRADNQQAYGDGQWVTNLTTQPNGIVTMVAQWSANEAHIRYNPNPPAGKTAGGNGTPNWDGHTGDTPAIGGNGWTIDGYTFAGWTTNADGSGTKYAPGASWTANGTLTLYAQWTPGQASLTYDGNGATGGKTDPQNGVTDQKVNVRQNGFTRDGYTFVRWDTQADCRGKAVNPGDKWTLQGSSTLYACWTGNMQPLTYHGNGATGGNTAAQSGHTGDELTTNANGFTRDGYTFVRWDTAKDGSGTAYGEGKNGVGRYTMKPAGNDLYAIWKANPATIQYRNDWPNTTGSTPDTTGVTGQDVTIARNGFTRPGYTFTGWARDRRTNPSLQPGGRYTLTPGTTTLWAQWKADPAHLIYNSNSGSTSQTRRTDGVVDQTLTVIANPFTRTGYTFTGWNTQADGRGRAYTAGNGFRLVADPKSNPVNTSVLYAQWRINRVTLKFDPNGGIGGYPDITVDAFTTVTIPADAKEPKVQRPGFRFTGWAMKPTPGAGDTILSPGKGTVSMPDQGSITVYAQWAPAMTTLPFTGGHAQVPTIWLYAGFALMLIALGVMMPMLRMRMAATKRTGKHMPITGGKHAK